MTVVNLASALPTITANDLWIIGLNGVPKIDGSATTDSNGNWQIVDPSPGSGCYTAFESLVVIVPIGSSEFSRTNCAVMLPAVLK